MNLEYLVIKDQEGGKQIAQDLCNKLAGNWQIVSALPTHGAVHYIIAEADMQPQAPLSDEDAQIIRDNLDATNPTTKE